MIFRGIKNPKGLKIYSPLGQILGKPYYLSKDKEEKMFWVPTVPFFVTEVAKIALMMKEKNFVSSLFPEEMDIEEKKKIKSIIESLYRLYRDSERLKSGEIKPLEYKYKEPEPYPHQKIGTSLLLMNPFFALFCEQGTGKTRMAIDAICNLHLKDPDKYKKVIVSAPISVLYSGWYGDLQKFATVDYEPYLCLGTREQKIKAIKSWIEAKDKKLHILLLGYDFIWRLFPIFLNPSDLDVFEKEFVKRFLDACKRARVSASYREKLKDKLQKDLIPKAISKRRRIFEDTLLFLNLLDEVDIAIADESQKIKTSSAKRTKAFLTIAMNAKRKYLLSGTPITNSPIDIYSQCLFLHPVFFASKKAFKEYFVEIIKRDKYEIDKGIKKGKKQEFRDLLNSFSYIVKKEDVLKDLPEKVFLERDVFLTKKTSEAYMELEESFVLIAQDFIQKVENEEISEQEKYIFAQNVLSKMQKLLQITSGFVLDDERKPYDIGTEKIEALLEVIEELGNESIVVWANFRYEVEKIYKALKKKKYSVAYINGEIPQKKRGKIIEEFQNGDYQILVANPSTLATGVTLTRASNAVYFSFSYRLEDFLQSQDRIHRIGQKSSSVNYYILLSVLDKRVCGKKNIFETMDRKVYKALKEKKKITDDVVTFVKQVVEEITLEKKS